MRLTFIVLIIAMININPGSLYANDSEYQEKLTNGIEAFYKADWNTAEEVFDALILKNPANPEGYFFRSMIPFWTYFFAGEDSDNAEDFMRWSERAVDIADRAYESDPNDTSTVLLLGGLYGYRGLVAANEGNHRSAIDSGVSGYRFSRKLMDMDTSNPDALIGQGMFNYMIGSIPGSLRWIGSLAGLSGDKDKGFELLERAANEAEAVSNDARMILTHLYLREDEPKKALEAITPLAEEYRENPIFQFYLAKSLEGVDRQDEAKDAYAKVVSIDHPKMQQLKSKSRERLDTLMAGL